MTLFQDSHQQSTAVPWTVRDTWLGASCLGMWLFLAYAVVILLKSLAVDISPGLMVALLELALIIPVWWFTRQKYGASWRHLGLTGFQTRYLGLGLLLFVPAMWLNALYEGILSQYDMKVQPELERFLADAPSPGLFIVAAVIIAPLVEEIFFRGFLFAGLKKGFSWPTAMLISSGLFALLHLRPLAAPPIFILGLVFAFLYQKSGSIWPAVIIHALVNSLAVIWVFARTAA
ncbi:MAG: CPBP family intramembrane glutamic endopeptidase [Desulfovermiculus sp.]